MLTILFNWIYIVATVFCLGFAFSVFSEKQLRYRIRRLDSILIAGLVIATVYSEIFSLIYRVNIEANVILILCCIVVTVFFRKRMFSYLKEIYCGCSPVKKILIPLIALVWCYFTSRGYMVVDAGLYHAQSIRWIEEYGIVKGLGNLQCRYAYNSSIFPLSALYSMVFLLGQSMHAVNGLIAVILSAGLLDLGKCFRQKKMLLSDYARVGAAYYLTTIWDEIVAPSSDYAVMCIVFFIVIRWLDQLEDPDERSNVAPYCLLCVMGAYTLTLKLTAGLILILLVKPAYLLLKEKRWKEILLYLLMGLLIAVPWMSRTVIISGWLLYPFPALDLFRFDWKMPVSVLNIDAALIKVWGKGANALGIDASFGQWFPNWFKTVLSFTEKLLVAGDIAACAMVVIIGFFVLFQKKREELDIVFVLFSVMCCYLFWQFSAPLPRYGYAYMLLLATLTAGYLLQDRAAAKPVYALLILYGVYKLYVGAAYAKWCFYGTDYCVWQQAYEESNEMVSLEIDGITFYASSTGWILGYENFPAAPALEDLHRIELRGDGLEDGFRAH